MSGKLLWTPSQERARNTNLHRFMQTVCQKRGAALQDYDALHRWSVENIGPFWEDLWDDLGIVSEGDNVRTVDDPKKMPGAKWFEGVRLNFAENLLRRRDGATALVFQREGAEKAERWSYARLYDETARLSKSLCEAGVRPGDRVAGFMPNIPHTIAAMLAATGLGAAWSSCSPDFGAKGALDRFGQIGPKVLFAADGYFYNGKPFDSLQRVKDIAESLGEKPRVVVVPYVNAAPDVSGVPNAVLFDEFKAKEDGLAPVFTRLPFDHPVYIMYSSGTTGLPKCMAHGAGGTLLNHLKELKLHADVKPEDNIFYFTTCGWMMWNWLVSALALGATVTLYDGSPFHPGPEALWNLAEREKVTIFGTSAKYIDAIRAAGLKPKEKFDLGAVKAVLSTGSPLSPENFEYVYEAVKSDLCLSSISGGTDIQGCFAGGNPMGPVYSGELQARGLGMDVRAFNDEGKPVLNEKGELVCVSAFPSMPVGFWNDPDGGKYRNAYFDVYPGVWRHGDFIEINDRGGVIVYGRSDATLNPGGVRIGTAEIYRVVEDLDEVEDSLVVGQDWQGDVRVVLFVKLKPGRAFDDALANKIKAAVRAQCTPRHVPAKVLPIADIPYTINMKKVEIAARKIIHGQDVQNRDALRNPEALELYRNLEGLRS